MPGQGQAGQGSLVKTAENTHLFLGPHQVCDADRLATLPRPTLHSKFESLKQ